MVRAIELSLPSIWHCLEDHSLDLSWSHLRHSSTSLIRKITDIAIEGLHSVRKGANMHGSWLLKGKDVVYKGLLGCTGHVGALECYDAIVEGSNGFILAISDSLPFSLGFSMQAQLKVGEHLGTGVKIKKMTGITKLMDGVEQPFK